jgi:hypothetical protein
MVEGGAERVHDSLLLQQHNIHDTDLEKSLAVEPDTHGRIPLHGHVLL